MKTRIIVAVLIALVVYVVAEQLASALTPPPASTAFPDRYYFWLLSAISALVCFLAVFAGSWIARGRFLTPALLLWAIPSISAMIMGYRLQQPADPVTIAEFVLRNLPMLSFTLAGTIAGVALGRSLARRKRGCDDTQAAT